mmetsp:Transcript_20411/g.36307  ORF Transcript_20411/g.36307 Transcript_20411/m.36307 type:complete len:739 (+) Transcript_20411:169-2385(+)|eukprot:CAMPEP_0197522076 /NCGR_PEP_ID=MMETSP1318-20131121/7270_1 /TAXON_ID=552666 /ORGANISM="Partenskyella glossopodia, Strain RCC365" /LENGTH=738 /DNA_ID=CAMNT_0043074307 /DNA_START=184 /DNA_END=2400 /DNA_ORIENTATION=+
MSVDIALSTLDERDLSITANDTDKISSLKERLSREEASLGPANKLVFVYDGTVLEDDMSVSECNIDPFASKRVVVFKAEGHDFVVKAPFLARTWDMEAKAKKSQAAGGGVLPPGAGGRGLLAGVPGLPGGMSPEQLASNPMVQQLVLAMMQQPGFADHLRRAMLQQAEASGNSDLKDLVNNMSDDELKQRALADLLKQIQEGGGAGGVPPPGAMPIGLPMGGFPIPGGGGFPVPGGGGSGVPRPTPAPRPDAKDVMPPGLDEARQLLEQVFPLADTNKDGFISQSELAKLFQKTSKKKIPKQVAQRRAREFFAMAALNKVKTAEQGIPKEEWVGFQINQFKNLYSALPLDQFTSELDTAKQAYRSMIKRLKEAKKQPAAAADNKDDNKDANKHDKEKNKNNNNNEKKQNASNTAATDSKSIDGGAEKSAGASSSSSSSSSGSKSDKKKIVKRKQWLPLESDPALVNRYMKSLGVDTEKWEWHDVFGFSPQDTAHLPTPAISLMLLFPISEQSEKARLEDQKESKQVDGVYHVKQTVGNACGTIAVLHSLLNNSDYVNLQDGKFFAKFHEQTKNMTSSQRAKALEESKDLEVSHEVIAKKGKTKANAREFANLHFISFVKVNDVLYELDGRKPHPKTHGPTSTPTFLEDALKVVRKFMSYTPNDRRYSVIVLAPKRTGFVGGLAPGGGGGGGVPDANRQNETIAKLTQMGIPAEQARLALAQTGWSANRAVEFYFTNMM